MTNPSPSRTTRVTTLVVGAAVAVVIGAVAFGFTRAGGPGDGSTPSASTVATTTSEAPTTTESPAPTAVPTTDAATPQPTATTGLASTAPISSALTARITSMKAVTAKATQPGQVGGPAVRFTIRLTNSSGAAVDLSSTVVNVYAGVDEAPAYQLDSDGLVFPASVAKHSSVTGTAVFTIPVADRGHVRVTVDTSAAATVVAFSGAAPKK